MWHRLPFDQKRRPSGYAPRVDGRAPPASEWIEVPAGCATLGVDRGSTAVRLGQRVRRVPGERAGVRDRAPRRHQRALPRVRRRRRLSRRALVARRGLAVDATERRRASAVLGASRRRVVLARHVRARRRCRCRGRSTSATPKPRRLRAGAARGCRPKPSSSARRTARRTGSGRIRGATTRRPPRTASSISRAGIPSRPAAIPTGRAPGASRISSATAGSGRARTFAPFPGFRPMPSYPEYSADFFDGEHFVMKGASPATARELLRPTFRNWFRAALSVRLRDLPLRAMSDSNVSARQPRGGDVATAQFASDVEYYLTLEPRQLPSRYLYDALGSALFEAICRLPWYRVTRAELRLLARARPRDPRPRRAVRDARRARAGQRREAGRAHRGGGRAGSAAARRASGRRLAGGARGRRARARRARRRAGRDAPRRRTRPGWPRSTRRRATRGRTLVLFLGSNIGNFDPPGADAFLRGIRAALAPRRRAALGADLVKPEARAAARLRRSARRHRGVQPQPAGPHQPRARRRLRPRRLRPPRRLERGGIARRDAPGQPPPAAGPRRGQRPRLRARRRARRSGPRAPTSTTPAEIATMLERAGFRLVDSVDRSGGRVRADARPRDLSASELQAGAGRATQRLGLKSEPSALSRRQRASRSDSTKLPTARSACSFTGRRRASSDIQMLRFLPTGWRLSSVIAGLSRQALISPSGRA